MLRGDKPSLTFHADGRPATEVIPLTIQHVGALDRAVPPLEIQSFGLRPAADHALNIEFIRIAVAVNDGQTTHLNVIAAGGEANCPKSPLPTTHTDCVTVPASERYLLAAKLDPVLTAIPIPSLRHSLRRHKCGAQECGECCAQKFQSHTNGPP
jgi:hypothetical protein